MLSRYLALPLALVQLAFAYTNSTTPHATITSPASTIAATRLLPATRPTQHTASFDLAHSAIDKELTTLEIANREFPITCVDCSTSGSLEVFVHNAEANDTSLFLHRKNKRDFDWPGPSGSLIARFPHGFEGHVELSLSTPAQLSHDITLFEWPLFGIDVPGIGFAGVKASLTIPLELALSGEAEVSFGFNFSLPRNASLAVHFPEIEDSTAFGFKDSQGLRMNALPVVVSTPGLDVALTTGLRLQLEVGVSASDDYVVETGATLDLPKVVVKESQLVNVDETCHPLSLNLSTAVTPPTFSSANTTWSNVTSELASAVGDYTHIAPSIGVDLDLYAKLDVKVDAMGLDFKEHKRTDWPIFATAWPLPTVCVDNRPSTSTIASSDLTSISGSNSFATPTSTPTMPCIETVSSGTWSPSSITTVTQSAWVA